MNILQHLRKKRHDENKRLKESRELLETAVDEKEKKIPCMNENIIEHETSKEVFKINYCKGVMSRLRSLKIEGRD